VYSVEDRVVPDPWEGDVLMRRRQTAIGTLVERHTRYVLLYPLPYGNTGEADTGVDVYFCDPKSPWQPRTNENTNGLLRQHLPKGTGMSKLTQTDLDKAAHSLNRRPRQTLDGMSPSEKLAEVLQ
jgi:IS30 family transposase